MRGQKHKSRDGVFISYARVDGEHAARALHQRLLAEAPDISAWLDRFEIEGGVGWWNQIEQELDRAEFLILMMTPAAMQSENTRREWQSARQRGVCVYPVKCVDADKFDWEHLPNWMRKAHFYDANLEWQKLLAHLRRGCSATRVPFMAPALPAGFIARPNEMQQLLDSILPSDDNSRQILTALRGPGGFGKTTLAAALCHDNRSIEAFDDGILWVTLGKSPNLLNEIVKLYAALTGERVGFVDIDDAARELALKLESKNCLIVIDDAWNIEHVRPFLQGATGCARLITTRLFELTLDAARIDVRQMRPAEALQLFLARSGLSTPDVTSIGRLAKLLGYWPLPIKLAAATMRQRMARGETQNKALEYLFRGLEKRGITAFDDAKAASREGAVADTVEASFELLSSQEQVRCIELTVFRAEEPVPITAAATLWQLDELDTEELARKLDECALIEFDLRLATLYMHEELRAFLQKRLPNVAAAHAKLVDGWLDPYNLPDEYTWRVYAYHLSRAERRATLRSLLLDLRWLEAKLNAAGLQSLLADFEYSSGDAILELVRDALRLAAPALAADRQQLRSQLFGRLLARFEPELVTLRTAAIAEASANRAFRLIHPTLDLPGGILVMTLVGHSQEVTSIAVDGDYRRLISASNDGTVRIWDTHEGRETYVFEDEHNSLPIRAVSLSADGAVAIAGGANGRTYLWDVEKRELLFHERNSRRGLTVLALSANGTVAVCASGEPKLWIWDVGKRVVTHKLCGHRDEVRSVAISSSGDRAISGSDDTTICVWNVRLGTLERVLTGHMGAINTVALSQDGRYALSGSSDRTLKLWDLDSGDCLRTLNGHDASVTAVALAADKGRAVSACSKRAVKLWDLETGIELMSLYGHSDVVRAIAVDRTGTRVATGSADSTLKLWRVGDPFILPGPQLHTGSVERLVFSPDGRLCASGGHDGAVRVIDVTTGHTIRAFSAHTAPVRTLAFTPDSACVISGGLDNKYWLSVIETGDCNWIPLTHSTPIDGSALSRVAHYLVTAGFNRYIYIWDMPSGARVANYGTRRLFDHLIAASPQRSELERTDDILDTYLPGEAVYRVHAVSMSPDGTRAIFSAHSNIPSGESVACLVALNIQGGEIDSINIPRPEPISVFAIDACGTNLVWARLDHAIELWDLKNETRTGVLHGHSQTVNAICVTDDGTRAFSCGRDRTVHAWDLAAKTSLMAFTMDAALGSIALAPDQRTLAVGDQAGRVHFLRATGI